jgi:hypothetical protein
MADDAREGMREERIPGERDPGTAMGSEAGIIAGTGFGENIPAQQPDTLTDDTRREREREGGGDPGQRPHHATHEEKGTDG